MCPSASSGVGSSCMVLMCRGWPPGVTAGGGGGRGRYLCLRRRRRAAVRRGPLSGRPARVSVCVAPGGPGGVSCRACTAPARRTPRGVLFSTFVLPVEEGAARAQAQAAAAAAAAVGVFSCGEDIRLGSYAVVKMSTSVGACPRAGPCAARRRWGPPAGPSRSPRCG
eukprot:TRINITY_DN11544_c0_g1_i1.p3 TRINITY_DN11544_c0_g1~~TRINITY_DN11544_c0_g1_i1.p3  ORF type:complete len:167 (+),score=8.60 TRINITY_DN11544_c0_g1_i1:70-570(+)